MNTNIKGDFQIYMSVPLSEEAEVFTQFTMLNKEVSSAKGLTSEFGRSFI